MPPLPQSLRILHTEWSTGWGGQEIRTLDEMLGLRERHGLAFHLACRPEARLGQAAREHGIPVHPLPFRGRLHGPTLLGLRQVIRRERINLLHAHSSIDAYAAGLIGRWTGTPVIRSRHLSLQRTGSFKHRLLYDGLAQGVICSSEEIRQTLVTHHGCRELHKITLPAAPDARRFCPQPAWRDRMREHLDLPPEAPVIGIVAMLRRGKGHALLLDAAAGLIARYPDLRVLVVGDGPQRMALEAQAQQLRLSGHVVFTGYRDDIPALMACMDVHVLPSLEEACAQSVIQAQLCGIPVIASDTGGLRELIESERNGLLFTPGDGRALRDTLTRALADVPLREALAREALTRARDRFDRDTLLAQIERLYRAVLGQGQRRPG